MRRTIRTRLLPAVTALATLVPVATAQAATCPAQGSTPPFNITRDVLINTEKTVSLPDGTGLPGGFVANNSTLTTGRFVTKFTNDSTGYSITSAENGPNWTTDDLTPTPGSAGSFTFIATGNNVNTFGPNSEAALGAKGIQVPVLAYTSGLLILHVVIPSDGSRPYVDNFSLHGKLVDGCALLAASG